MPSRRVAWPRLTVTSANSSTAVMRVTLSSPDRRPRVASPAVSTHTSRLRPARLVGDGLAARHVVTDLLIDAVLDGDATHAVAGLPGADGTETLVVALGRLRSSGATSFGAALPAEGDPVGLGGPPGFNDAALEAGEAVVVDGAGLGLVPVRVGAAITWVAAPRAAAPAARRRRGRPGLRAALLETAEALADLDVARWRPEVADRADEPAAPRRRRAPDGVPPRRVELAGPRPAGVAIVDLALEDDGGAVTAYEIESRRAALGPRQAGRRGLVAACSPEVWPPALATARPVRSRPRRPSSLPLRSATDRRPGDLARPSTERLAAAPASSVGRARADGGRGVEPATLAVGRADAGTPPVVPSRRRTGAGRHGELDVVDRWGS